MQEAFFKWVKEKYDVFIEYYFDGMVSDDELESNKMANYRLGWIPEGYVESDVYILPNITTVTYVDDTSKSIKLNYYTNPTSTNLLIKQELYEYSTISFSDIIADIYISKDAGESTIIVMTGEKQNILFSISAFLSKDELIKMVENIIILDEN